MGFAVNRKTSNPELETGGYLGQRCLRARATGETVSDNADVVAAIGLSIGKIEDVAEDSADRRAHRVQNTKRLV